MGWKKGKKEGDARAVRDFDIVRKRSTFINSYPKENKKKVARETARRDATRVPADRPAVGFSRAKTFARVRRRWGGHDRHTKGRDKWCVWRRRPRNPNRRRNVFDESGNEGRARTMMRISIGKSLEESIRSELAVPTERAPGVLIFDKGPPRLFCETKSDQMSEGALRESPGKKIPSGARGRGEARRGEARRGEVRRGAYIGGIVCRRLGSSLGR